MFEGSAPRWRQEGDHGAKGELRSILEIGAREFARCGMNSTPLAAEGKNGWICSHNRCAGKRCDP
jgi:hypothetical protein